MANKFYNLIDKPIMEINGKNYQTQTYNISLKDLLEKYYDKEIYIYAASLEENIIRAIII